MRQRTGTIPWPGWLLAAAIIAALAAVFILTAPGGAQAHEADEHEFELRCHPGTDNTSVAREVNEGDDFTLQAKWHDRSGVGTWKAEWDTNQLDAATASLPPARQSTDFEPEHDELHSKSRAYSTFNHTFHTKEDDRWEGNEEYDAGYSAIRPSGGTDRPAHYCRIIIIDDDPLKVTSLRLWGRPANDRNFTVGETIHLRMKVTGNINVPEGGNLILELEDGDGTVHERRAHKDSVLSTSDRPVYAYRVTAGDPKATKISVKSGFHTGPVRGVTDDGTITDVPVQYYGTPVVQTFEQQQGTYTDPVHFGVDGRPKATSVAITSQPQTDHVVMDTNNLGRTYTGVVSDKTYRAGDHIDVTTTFDQEVVADKSVGISLRIAEGDSNTWRAAWYHSGSNTDQLVFRYTVEPDDRDDDGVGVDSGGLQPNGALYGFTGGGLVRSAVGNIALNPSYSGFKNNANHKVDGRPIIVSTGIISEPQADNTYWENEVIEFALNYNNPVNVTGTPTIDVELEDPDHPISYQGHREVAYASGSGTNQLVFSYTVLSDDRDSDGVRMRMGGGDFGLEGGSITAAADSSVTAKLNYTEIYHDPDHKVDGAAGDRSFPSITSTLVTSDPGDDGYYVSGDVIELTATFSKDLVITSTDSSTGNQAQTGPIALTIGIGDTPHALPYLEDESGANEMVFQYTVQDGDNDSDGISLMGNAITLKNTTVQDADGNDADLGHDALGDDGGHKVDTVRPRVDASGLTSWPARNNTYSAGEEITVRFKFNEAVDVTGTPTLTLRFSEVDKVAEYKSHNLIFVTFAYVVELGDNTTLGVAYNANAISRSGGDITDLAGNTANLEHNAAVPDAAHQVDGKDRTPPAIESFEFTSDPGSDEEYGLGDIIEVTVTFSEDVTVTGSPRLKLYTPSIYMADYRETDGNEVSFRYTVQSGDEASDGTAIARNAVVLNGGTIRDGAGNHADLSNATISPDPEHSIDGSKAGSGDTVEADETAPTVAALLFASNGGDDETYYAGDNIQVSVRFSESVAVTGSPQIELQVGDDAKQAGYVETQRRRHPLPVHRPKRRQRRGRRERGRQQDHAERRHHQGPGRQRRSPDPRSPGPPGQRGRQRPHRPHRDRPGLHIRPRSR